MNKPNVDKFLCEQINKNEYVSFCTELKNIIFDDNNYWN